MIFYDNANCGHDRATQFDQTETEKKNYSEKPQTLTLNSKSMNITSLSKMFIILKCKG